MMAWKYLSTSFQQFSLLSRKTDFNWVLEVDKLKCRKVKGFANGGYLNHSRTKINFKRPVF